MTTTVGLGAGWLTERMPEFLDLYPEIQLQLILANEELDLTHAPGRLRDPPAPAAAAGPHPAPAVHRAFPPLCLAVPTSTSTASRQRSPISKNHRIVTFGVPVPSHLAELNWLETVGDFDGGRRVATLQINDILSIKRAVQRGAGIAMLPDYMVEKDSGLVQLLPETEVPSFDTYFCYPDAMKNQAKLHVFRDFIIAKARNWSY